jgi:hypothetical protein
LNVYHSANKGEMPWTGEMPILVHIHGVPMWRDAASGRTFPLVAGAEDPPPDPDTDKDKNRVNNDDPPLEKWDEDRARRTIDRQREEARALRLQLKELDALKAKDAQREREKLSETERLAAEKADLEKKLADHETAMREMRTEHAIERAATNQGARKPTIVARLVDRSKLEYDGDGNPINADELVKALLKDEPYLVGKGDGTTGVPGSPRSNATLTRDDEVKKNRDELRASPLYQPLG